jgi:PAS domain S-box-containing protein
LSEELRKFPVKNGWRTKVFDSLSLPTLVLKPDMIILDANRQFFQEFKLEAEQVLGKKCHDFFFHSQKPCSLDACPLSKVLREKQGHSVLKQVHTKEGAVKWEDRVFSPVLDDHGEVAFIIESIRDVTQIRNLEKELSEIKAFTKKVIQSSASAIVAADMKGEILVMNQAAEELFGYTIEEARNKINIGSSYPPGQAREIMRKLRSESFGGKGKLPCTRITIINPKGVEIPSELTAAIIYEDGVEVATMGIFNDLREKLADEERMSKMLARVAQAEKMASLGQLAAGVAHEINNPLTGILFYANLLLERLKEDDPTREDLRCILEDAGRCRDIVKNLLAYSRQTQQMKETFQLNLLVDQSLSLIRDQKLFMNIEIKKDMSEDMMLICADKIQLSQVVVNLVINAIHAMDRKGSLTLRTYRDKSARKAFLEVSDTGCGIPTENLSKIFDPFFTTKQPGKGTGLGLSTAYGIVHENGGNITVKQTGPGGTTFLVELPLYHSSDNDSELL